MAELKIDISKVVEGAIKEFKHQGYNVSKWISVDERLPEGAEAEVLVWIEDGTADGIKIYDSLHIAYWYGDEKVFADLNYDEVKGVTHWMYTSAISKPPMDGESK